MPEQQTPAITCSDIVKTYGENSSKVVALRGISLSINPGELRLFMGPSGSGKTTLISIIAGILTQDSGNVRVLGTDLSTLSDTEKTNFRCKNIGFLFQVFNLIPMLTAEENISIPLLLNGVNKDEALERSKQLLSDLSMGDKIGKHPNQLSGGQQQRVAIARAIVHGPKLIVCDEPTSYLDHHTGTMIMELLQSMVRKNNVTLIVVTHDARIVQFADKIDYLEDGKIIENPATAH